MLLLMRPVTIGLGLTTAFVAHSFYRSRPLLCESSGSNSAGLLRKYSEDAKVPVFRNGRPNPAAYKQISAGSILGRSPLELEVRGGG